MHKMSRGRRLDSRSCKVHSGKEPGNTLHAISVASLPAIAPRDGRREITAQDPMPLRICGQSSLACRWQREIAHMRVCMAAHPFRIAATQRLDLVAPDLLARAMQSALSGA